MIPQRIYVAGFLCYREPVEACFDGQSLWMLAGPNGSGKSSLFDAITFALYGRHRGGKQNIDALINTRSDGLVVEFDFLLDGELYRARRAHHRQSRPTRSISRREPETGQWREAPATASQAGFDRWVRENIGLTDSTFRASMMLRQGEADRLLTLEQRERMEFLGEIIGLEQYERLHQRAEEHRKKATYQAEELARRLSALDEVSAEQLASAEAELLAAAEAIQQADARVQALSALAVHAQTWKKCDDRRSQLRQRIGALETILRDRAAIQAQADRLRFLDGQLSGLARTVELAEQSLAGEQRRALLRSQAQTLSERRRRMEEASAEQTAALAQRERELETLMADHQTLGQQSREQDAALPWLETLCRFRAEQRQAEQAATDARRELARLEAQRGATAAEEPSPETLEHAEQSARDAEAQRAQADAKRQAAREVEHRFHQVKDQRACPYCRQDLPPDHVARESARLNQEHQDAGQAFLAAERHALDARRRWDELRSLARSTAATLRDLDHALHDQRHLLEMAERKRADCLRECDEARRRLPAAMRERLDADAAFPACADLRLLREDAQALAGRLAALERRMRQVRDDLRRLRESLAEQETNRRELDQQARRRDRDLAACEADVRHLAQALEAAQAALPEPWRAWSREEAARRLPALRTEQRELAASDVAARCETLQQAQDEHDERLKERQALERQIEDIPLAARRDPAELQAELQQADHEKTDCRHRHAEADKRLDALRRNQRDRETLDQRYRQADRQRHLWRRLADLLGRQGLQRELVRTSERQIVEYADAILDRLSSGALHLELRAPADDETERALDLAARTDTSPDPIDAPFLSGSQRFRVAVALSLAIGQYASHHRRPVRSVIIDEGFGCLDPDNRQTMIQELHNLRTHLDRIILVTHQDDIAQAFPNGYYCQPNEGSTHLIPFHR